MTRQGKSFAALAGVVAVLLFAAWWVLRAPALEHQAAAPPPDIDIDPPAMRARRQAAIALATMPDDPWSFAESLAASAPVKAAEKEDCGVGDGPRYDKPAGEEDLLVQTGGPSLRYMNAQAGVDASLRSSGDALDRAVADLINVGDMRSDAGRDEAVVQQAVVTTDARLYALGYGLCHAARSPAPSCAAISLERWTQIDPGNGIPWVDMLAQAQARGDAAGVQTAMARLASASRFDIHLSAAAGAVVSRLPEDERDLAAVNELTFKAFTQAAVLPLPPFQPLLQTCRNEAGGDERLAQACRAISDVMYEHSDNLISQSISGALLQQTTGDGSRREMIRAERAVLAAHWSPATGFSECHEMRDSMKKLLRSAQVGEVEAMREQARKFVTP
jgi:hypothetical protein